MIPIILVSDSKRLANSFIKDQIKERDIAPYNVLNVEPEKKDFSIQEVRELKKTVSFHTSEEQLYILWAFDTAAKEAQNAFLKTLEEHQETIQFILVVKNHHSLLPTILSRARVVALKSEKKKQEDSIDLALNEFLKSGDIGLLADAPFQTKKTENPGEIFESMVDFFRRRLSDDAQSTDAIRVLLKIKSNVESNHVNLQAGVDAALLHIRSLYNRKAH